MSLGRTRFRALVRVHAGRHGVAIVGSNRSRTAGEGGEQENGTECGKKNGSHICMLVLADIRKRLRE